MFFPPIFTILAAIVASLATARGSATSPTSRPSPISYRAIARGAPPAPLRMYVVTIDLTDPRVHLRVVPGGADPDGVGDWNTTLRTVREMASDERLDVAVNGNFFASKETRAMLGRRTPYFPGNFARAIGWGVTDGKVWSDARDTPGCCELIVRNDGHTSIERVRGTLPDGVRQMISGANDVLFDGRITQRRTERAPRTSVGIDRDEKRLTILVADGRRNEWSVGLTEAELGKVMLDLGCARAINLDGGGSSTLVMRDESAGELKLINRPSDGHDLPIPMSFERNVASAFGVRLSE